LESDYQNDILTIKGEKMYDFELEELKWVNKQLISITEKIKKIKEGK